MSEIDTNKIVCSDCFDFLANLPKDSIHACVTDPPYGLAFMGRDWDDFEPKEYQEWCEKWAREVKRVLKPGGHLLAFSGNRTHHRLFTGVEDAGFEIRDTLTWHYGSGFPKASDISKIVDKRKRKELIQHLTVEDLEKAGIPDATRTHQDWIQQEHTPSDEHWQKIKQWVENADKVERPVIGRVEFADNTPRFTNVYADKQGERTHDVTEPATDAAKKWDGWKTGLKPATEYVVMARKPFDGATVDCVLEHGTGALNIDSCRVEGQDAEWTREGPKDDITGANFGNQENHDTYMPEGGITSGGEKGRYPSNVVFDEVEAERLDKEVGDVDGCTPHRISDAGKRDVLSDGGLGETEDRVESYEDQGGPSRYFYTSKATKAERTLDGRIENSHPTVKPQDLMEWLVKLVTREGQIVVDPFCGSGTTCKAAKELNREFIGIEKQPKWADVARVRVGLTPEDPSVVRGDDNQEGLEAFSESA